MEYKRLDTGGIVNDVGSYIKEILKIVPFSKIYVGTDSQNTGDYTVYATVIVLHYNGNNGGHVIFSKDSVPRIRDKYEKLWGEVARSVDAANFLKNDCGISVQYIDLDLNANVKEDSNKILASAVGFVESYGYGARYKPGPAFAVRVADILCRPKRRPRQRHTKRTVVK